MHPHSYFTPRALACHTFSLRSIQPDSRRPLFSQSDTSMLRRRVIPTPPTVHTHSNIKFLSAAYKNHVRSAGINPAAREGDTRGRDEPKINVARLLSKRPSSINDMRSLELNDRQSTSLPECGLRTWSVLYSCAGISNLSCISLKEKSFDSGDEIVMCRKRGTSFIYRSRLLFLLTFASFQLGNLPSDMVFILFYSFIFHFFHVFISKYDNYIHYREWNVSLHYKEGGSDQIHLGGWLIKSTFLQ